MFVYDTNKPLAVNCSLAVADIIRQALDYGSGCVARVHGHWIIAPGIVESLPALTTGADSTWTTNPITPFIHGYCVGYGGIKGDPLSNNRRGRETLTFSVWAFYQVFQGNESKNSDHIFLAHRERIRSFLRARPRLQTQLAPTQPIDTLDGLPRVLTHNGLIFEEPEVLRTDKASFYLARGSIEVIAESFPD